MNETSPKASVNALFTNSVVPISTITMQDMPLVPLSTKYRRINIIYGTCVGLIFASILTVIGTGVLFDLPEDLKSLVIWGYFTIGVITLLEVGYHYFADPLKQYALREHDLNFQSGLIFRSMVSQPILRIQHIEIKRGLIERKAGLATLQVFSAGGASHTFTIPGLEYSDAIALRQFILDHKDLAADV